MNTKSIVQLKRMHQPDCMLGEKNLVVIKYVYGLYVLAASSRQPVWNSYGHLEHAFIENFECLFKKEWNGRWKSWKS